MMVMMMIRARMRGHPLWGANSDGYKWSICSDLVLIRVMMMMIQVTHRLWWWWYMVMTYEGTPLMRSKFWSEEVEHRQNCIEQCIPVYVSRQCYTRLHHNTKYHERVYNISQWYGILEHEIILYKSIWREHVSGDTPHEEQILRRRSGVSVLQYIGHYYVTPSSVVCVWTSSSEVRCWWSWGGGWWSEQVWGDTPSEE